jgi:hypothetical protein
VRGRKEDTVSILMAVYELRALPSSESIDHNIKIVLKRNSWGGRDWIDLPLDRNQWRALANTVMNLRVP